MKPLIWNFIISLFFALFLICVYEKSTHKIIIISFFILFIINAIPEIKNLIIKKI